MSWISKKANDAWLWISINLNNDQNALRIKWAKPVLLKAGGETIHIQAGPNGSIQGPAEAKWGYTFLTVADWDHDGLLDLVVNDIWGKVIWVKNNGRKGQPKLAPARPVKVAGTGTPPNPAWNWWQPKPGELSPPMAHHTLRCGLE